MMHIQFCWLLFVVVFTLTISANGSPADHRPQPDHTDTTGIKTYRGKQCHFPFQYKSETYTECTTVDHPRNRSWCFTQNEDGTQSNFKDLCVGDKRNAVVVTYGGNGRGAPCHFPFLKDGKKYDGCTNHKKFNGRYWCSTSYDFDVDQKWGYCNVIDTLEQLERANRNIESAWDPTTCVFPFVYNGETHHGCVGANLWCSTTPDYDRDQQSKVCDENEFVGIEGPIPQGTTAHCTFPYMKDGILMSSDITMGRKRFCPTTFNVDQHRRIKLSGRQSNEELKCKLPFTHNNVVHYDCIVDKNFAPWCPTTSGRGRQRWIPC